MTEVETREVLRLYRSRGYTVSFRVSGEGRIQCSDCDAESDPQDVRMEALHRLEGTSDPDYMAAVVAMSCPGCGARGTWVSTFGSEISAPEASALGAMQDHRQENKIASGW